MRERALFSVKQGGTAGLFLSRQKCWDGIFVFVPFYQKSEKR